MNSTSYKRIGILGGLSYESTADLYDLIMEKHTKRFNNSYYPEIVIFSLNFQRIIDLQDAENLDVSNYIKEISVGLRALEKAGVDFIVIAANTPHMLFKEISQTTEIPMRSIVTVTLDTAIARGFSKLLLLGTKRTMSMDFFKELFISRGIDLLVPTAREQEIVNTIIFQDLVRGDVAQSSKKQILDIAGNYDVEGVILGCTELSMIIKPEDTPLPLLDTLDIQAEDILNYAST